MTDDRGQKTVKRLKILKTHLEELPTTHYPQPTPKLVLDLVQLEGKKPVSWEQFKQGYPKIKVIKHQSL